jgi:hypothetical protein
VLNVSKGRRELLKLATSPKYKHFQLPEISKRSRQLLKLVAARYVQEPKKTNISKRFW